ncbi:tautomerase family protein [Actinoplanes sp. NPDC051346]|uniref:tautomerase family protein n=1 Tax=Actinoplanes sp. NPDC051346 TaxID=3155048 RepID=UPI0034396BBF
MPFITVLAIRGSSVEQRREFAAKVTELAVSCLNAKPQEVRVHFTEMDRSEFARAGRLMSDDKG